MSGDRNMIRTQTFVSVLLSLLSMLLIVACDYDLSATNPFDPDTPPEDQAKASVTGQVELEFQSAGQQDGVTITIEGEGQTLTTTSVADGSYSFEGSVVPGSWSARFSMTGYAENTLDFTITAADSVALPLVQLTKRRALLTGNVTLEGIDAAGNAIENFSGVMISLRQTSSTSAAARKRIFAGDEDGDSTLPEDGDVETEDATQELTYTALTDENGNYLLDGVPFGSYLLIAGKEGYSNDSDEVEVDKDSQRLPDSRLISSQGAVLIAQGAAFTNKTTVPVTLRSSGPIKFWWLSEDPTFEDESTQNGEISDVEQLDITLDFTLSEGDGLKTVYGRYETFDGLPSEETSDSITLDTTPPQSTKVLINQGETYTTDGVVELSLSAQDRYSEVVGMRVSLDGELDEETVVDYTLADTVTLPVPNEGDGVELPVIVSFIDGAGNESDPVSDTILFDNIAPQAGTQALLINEGDEFTAQALVTLDFDISGASKMKISNDSGFGDANWQTYSPTVAGWRLAANGSRSSSHTVYAKFADDAGNETEAVQDDITLDTTGSLSGIISIIPADTQTPYADLNFALDGQTLGSGVGSVSVNDTDGSFTISDIPYGTYGSLTVSKSDFSPAQTGAIIVSPGQTSDLGTLTLSSLYGKIIGQLATNPADTTDPFTGISFELDGSLIENAEIDTENGSFTIPHVAVGLYTSLIAKKARFQNAASGVLQVRAATAADAGTLTLTDRYGSISGQLGIEGSAALDDVVLSLGGTTAPQAVIEQNGTFTIPDVLVGSYAYVAANKDGYSEARSEFVTVSPGEDAPVGLLQLNLARGGIEGYARLVGRSDHAGILLKLAGTGYTMVTDSSGYFYRDEIITGSYELIATKDGFQQRNLDGVQVLEEQTSAVNDGDTPLLLSPQTGDFNIEGGAAYTNQVLVDLALEYDNAAMIRVSEDDAFFLNPDITEPPFVDLTTLQTEGTVTVDPDGTIHYAYTFADSGDKAIEDGPKTIYVQFMDTNFVPSDTFSASIILDRIEPNLAQLLINDDAEYTNSAAGLVALALSAYDDNGVDFVYLSSNGTDFQPRAYTPLVTYMLAAPTEDGEKSVYAYFVDPAGNQSAIVSDSIILDTTPPQFVHFAIDAEVEDGEDKYSTTSSVRLSIEASGADRMKISNQPSFAGADWEAYQTSRTWVLPLEETLHAVFIQFSDDAGNAIGTNADYFDSVILDTTAPNSPQFALAGDDIHGSYARSEAIQLQFTNAPTDVRVQIDSEIAFSEAPFDLPVGGLVDFMLDDLDGVQLVYARYVDIAGNASEPSQKTVILDRIAPYGEQISVVQGSIVNDATVTLSLNAIGASELSVHESDTCPQTNWTPYVTQKSVTATAGNGQKTFSVMFRDEAHNVSNCVTTSFYLDESDPTVSLQINEDAEYSNSRAVTLTILAADGEPWGGLAGMRLTNNAPFTTESYEPVQDSKSWMLPTLDGEKTVWIEVIDLAGNTAQANASITLDTAAPSASLVINDTDGYSQSGTVSITITAQDGISADEDLVYLLSNSPTFPADSSESGSYTTGGVTRNWTLSEGDGQKTVYLRVQDLAGNLVEASDSTILDSAGPSGSYAYIEEGEYLNDPDCNLIAYAAGADQMYIEGDVTDTADTFQWISFSSQTSITLDTTEGGDCGDTGACSVSVSFRDNAGHTDGPIEIPVTLDMDDPTGTMVIDQDASHTDNAAVTLTFDVSDATTDVTAMRINNVNAFDGLSWEVFVSSRGWVLPSTNGSHTVYAQVKDAAGNILLLTDDIILDNQAPVITSFEINSDDDYTNSRNVTLAVSATDNETGQNDLVVYFSNEPSFSGATSVSTTNGQATTAWTLSEGDGSKNVYVRIVDEAGNLTDSTDDIVLDSENPTASVSILGSDPTRVNTATLNLSSSADTTHMKIENTDSIDCSSGVDTPYQSQISSWSLGDSSGTITVSVCFKDAAGNTSSASDSVVLDLDLPSGTLSINDGDERTNNRLVTLSFDNVDDTTTNVTSMRITNNSTFTTEPWESYVSARSWLLPSNNGERTVKAQLKDAAGNVASIESSIILDTTAPHNLVIQINDGDSYTQSRSVSLTVNAQDNLSTAANLTVLVSNDASFNTSTTVDIGSGAASISWTLESGNGTQFVYLRVTDQAGNAANSSDSIFLDSENPIATLTIDAEGPTNDNTADIIMTASSDVTEVAVERLSTASIDCSSASYIAYNHSNPVIEQLDLGSTSGTVTVAGCFRDASGRTTIATDSIVLDLDAPTEATVTIRGDDPTNDPTIALYLTAPEDVNRMSIGGGSLDCSTATYEAFNPYPSRVVNSTTGEKTIKVCFKDEADNVAFDTTTVYLDVTKPTGTVTIAETSPTNGLTVTLQMLPAPPVNANSISQFMVLETATPQCNANTADLTAWTDYTQASLPYTVTRPQGDEGMVSISVCFRDAAGNTNASTAQIYVDLVEPTGTISLDQTYYRDAGGPNDLRPDATITRNHSDAASMAIAVTTGFVTPDCSDEDALTYIPFSTSTAVDLIREDSEEGGIRNFLWLCLKDSAGNVTSEPAYTSCIVDTNAPEGTIEIGGDDPTNNISVPISFSGVSADVNLVAIANENITCSSAAYQSFEDGQMTGWILSGVDGTRRVYACFKDRAGNISSDYDTVYLDTTPPVAGTLLLAGGDDLVNSAIVPAGVVGGDSSYQVRLGGDLSAGGGLHDYDDFPFNVTLADANGLNTVTAVFIDEAGNTSNTFFSVIEADTRPPQLGTIQVNGESDDGGLPLQIEDASIVVEIFPADSDAVYFEISETESDLDSCQITGDSCAAITPSKVFSVSTSLGMKTLYYRFFDQAMNGSTTNGEFALQLVAPQPVRPVPVLSRLYPQSLIAFSASNYTITVIGSQFATDTAIRVGDFELTATCTGLDGSALGVTCTDANLAGDSCDPSDTDCYNCCATTLIPSSPAWALVQNAGSYLTRIVTPSPVTGTGVSVNSAFLNVVAPKPELFDFTVMESASTACLEGIVDQCSLPLHNIRYVMESDSSQSFDLMIWGRKFMNNIDFSIQGTNALVRSVIDDPDPPSWDPYRQIALAQVFDMDLQPQDDAYTLTASNPNPGGGQATMGFGVNYAARSLDALTSSTQRNTDYITYESDYFEERYDALDNLTVTVNTLESSAAFFLSSPYHDQTLAGYNGDGELLYRLNSLEYGSGIPLGTNLWTLALGARPGTHTVEFNAPLHRPPSGAFSLQPAVSVGDGPNFIHAYKSNANLPPYAENLVVLNYNDNSLTALYYDTVSSSYMELDSHNLGSNPARATVADFNRDNYPDIAVGHQWNSDTVSLLYGNSDGTFDEPDVLSGLNSAEDIEAGDLNGDSFPDIVLSERQSNRLSMYFNTGGSDPFSQSPVSLYAPSPIDAELADMNGDGILDIVSASASSSRVTVFLNKGDGTFETGLVTATSAGPIDLAIADFNHDGVLDIAVANGAWVSDDHVNVLLGNGDGTMQPAIDIDVKNNDVTSISAADLNGNGHVDLVAGFNGSTYATFLFNDGTASFTGAERNFGLTPRFLITGNFSSDYNIDLAMVYNGGDQIRTLINIPGTAWTVTRTHGSGTSNTRPQLADLNRDGALDVLVPQDSSFYLSLLLGNGDGSTQAAVMYNTHTTSNISYPSDLAIMDFNGDGYGDVAATNSCEYIYHPRTIGIRMGDGAGALGALTTYATDSSPYSIISADFDNDDDPDIAAVAKDSDMVNVYINNGSGVFGTKVQYSVDDEPTSIAAADVNNDGAVDLIVGHWMYKFSVLLGTIDGSGKPTGTFGTPTTFSTETNGNYGLQVADFNRDGLDDIITSNYNAGTTVELFIGDGAGGFDSSTTFPAIGDTFDLVVSDFDGNGMYDIATCSFENNYAAVLLGNGDGTLSEPVLYSADNYPKGVAAGDLNGDGGTDLIIANNGSSALRSLTPAFNPEPINQELRMTELDLVSVEIPAGPSESASFNVHQATQDLEEIAIELYVEFAEEPSSGSLTTTLTAPNGYFVTLATHDVGELEAWPSASPTAWRLIANYPPHATVSDLSTLLTVQPTGDWTVTITNDTSEAAEVKSISIHTLGRLVGPGIGGRSDVPERLNDSRGASWTGRVVRGSTLGYADNEDLSCATTSGSPDRYYQISIRDNVTLERLSVVGSFDSAVELRSGACSASSYTTIACNDDGGGVGGWGQNPRIIDQALGLGTYCIVVDGVTSSGNVSQGEYYLYLRFSDPILGK